MELILSFALPFIWIFYFYKKDCHPEPLKWLIFAFFLGIFSAVCSFYAEILLSFLDVGKYQAIQRFLFAVTEEFFKLIFVAVLIFPKRVVDEPIDFMIYMFFSAFGFAFIENFFFLLKAKGEFFLKESIYFLALARFLGANFLHLLASGLVGYGMALSYQVRRIFPLIIFFFLASFLHFLYNWSIIMFEFNGYLLIMPVLWAFFMVTLVELRYLRLHHGRSQS